MVSSFQSTSPSSNITGPLLISFDIFIQKLFSFHVFPPPFHRRGYRLQLVLLRKNNKFDRTFKKNTPTCTHIQRLRSHFHFI